MGQVLASPRVVREAFYIGGAWRQPSGAGAIPVTNPATEEMIGEVPRADRDDVNAAVSAARDAFPSWARRAPAERAAYLERLSEKLTENAESVARLIASEVGMPMKLSRPIQAAQPALVMSSYAKIAREFAYEQEVGNSIVVREPAGVVAAVTPWNVPLHQIVAKVAPSLAAGCTVVLKPSSLAPLNAYLLADLVDAIGLPAGVFNLITGDGAEAGAALARHSAVDVISFTGSTEVGRRVIELAAGTIKRVALELGGKSANVVLPDADFGRAIKSGVNNAFVNSGQMCNALTRMLVPRERQEEVIALATEAARALRLGDPLDESSRLGPVISADQRDRVRGYITRGVKEGARLVMGGAETPAGLDRGYFVQPTIFSDVESRMPIARDEIFGPVLSIIPYANESQAIEIANDTIYGLGGAVWSADAQHAKSVARQMRTGQVDINGGRFNPVAPFGGYKQSGLGRELGVFGLEEFLQTKAIQV